MNGYDLSRNFFNWSFDNPELVKPIHLAIFFFAMEHQNRLGGKEKFGFPSQMTMDAIGVKKYQTYGKALNDLSEWGFISFIEKSKNQYSANIICINAAPKNGIARGKALDKATIKHRAKQSLSTGQSTGQGKDSITKPINQEPLTTLYSEKDFLIDWKTQREKFLKKPTNVSRLSPAERTSLREVSKDFKREEIKNGLEALFRQQVINFTSMHSRPQHYLDHIDKYQTAFEEKDTRLYGAVKQDSRL